MANNTSDTSGSYRWFSRILNRELARSLEFFLYRRRFLLAYVAIGIASLVLELLVLRGLRSLAPAWAATPLSVAAGVYFAFWMNIRFNFRIPTAKRNRALLYFAIISMCSASINFVFKRQLERHGWGYGEARIVIAGILFSFAYLLHRKLSFADYKKVGVAIYANGIENIQEIYRRIGAFPDFIHVDIIDDTFGTPAADPQAYRMEAIRAYWDSKPIHVHIMSRQPSRWLDAVMPFVDTVFVHTDVDDDLKHDIIPRIRAAGRKVGLCVTPRTPPEQIRGWLEHVDTVMLLAIAVPGKSGQPLEPAALAWLDTVNQWPERHRIALCVDGGVNERNIGRLNVEHVVSGSSVLNNANPRRQIMRLQTSGHYEPL